jgi:uncharacterized glyoxalase superfamily protein PhnB
VFDEVFPIVYAADVERTVEFYEVEDVDAASAHLLALGVKQLQPPTDRPWGERNAYFEDPDGNPIHVYVKERLDSAE